MAHFVRLQSAVFPAGLRWFPGRGGRALCVCLVLGRAVGIGCGVLIRACARRKKREEGRKEEGKEGKRGPGRSPGAPILKRDFTPLPGPVGGSRLLF